MKMLAHGATVIVTITVDVDQGQRDMPEDQNTALMPSATRNVDFYGDELQVALVGNVPYVAIRPITESLGLAWAPQYQRLHRDEVLARHIENVAMTGADGKLREMTCLQLEYLPGWLFGITPSRTRPEVAPKLTRYREECFQILWRAFQTEILERMGTPAATTMTAPVALAQVRDLALAIAQMAEQQMAIQEQVSGAHQRLDRAAIVVGDLQRRISIVEQRTEPASLITDAQAAEIAAAVKALAELLMGQDASKNHYQGIFSELYRRFGVSSYKLIRREQYEAVLSFLDSWRRVANGSA